MAQLELSMEQDTGFSAPTSASLNLANLTGLENIKVAVRLRPFTGREKKRNSRRIVDIEQNTVILHNPKYTHEHGSAPKKFTFDHSYWSHDGFKKDQNGVNVPDPSQVNGKKYVGQEEIFRDVGTFLLDNVLAGYNAALLAYGQTGSGKSYTVSGYGQNEGILPRFARALFQRLEKEADIFFSMLEIYNEVARDLLAKQPSGAQDSSLTSRRGLKVREHPKYGFFVEKLTSHQCTDRADIERRIEEGQLNKSIAATSMNESSSRGHTIYEFRIKRYASPSDKAANENSDPDPSRLLTYSTVQLVDLAGSERLAVHSGNKLGELSFIGSRASSSLAQPLAATLSAIGNGRDKIKQSIGRGINKALGLVGSAGSAGHSNPSPQWLGEQLHHHNQRFKESVSINQSLSALGNCIQVLSHYSQQQQQAIQSPQDSATQPQLANKTSRPPPKIPYRDSVLTKLLNRCCLSGTSKVAIIATLSPSESNYDDTLSTLRFADRAKQIRTHATVNETLDRTSQLDSLQRENQRLRHLMGDRKQAIRSDDSSQTSNFDESETTANNFLGLSRRRRAAKASNGLDMMASPLRSRTSIKRNKSRQQQPKQIKDASSFSSNPSLQVREQMKRLVSPAHKKMSEQTERETGSIPKSRSTGHSLSLAGTSFLETSPELVLDLDQGSDDIESIKEGFLSPESDDDLLEDDSALGEKLREDEKINMINRLLSNSLTETTNQSLRRTKQDLQKSLLKQTETMHPVGRDKERRKTRQPRPKRASHTSRSDIKRVSVLSNSLKRKNPYLSNLNADEQLSGLICYIIKQGETVLGKSPDSDVVLRGTELRGKHAKILRDDSNGIAQVFIEPVLSKERQEISDPDKARQDEVAIRVNGNPVNKKTLLKHGDRVLFGTNCYFVLVNNQQTNKNDEELVNYDHAHNEVLSNLLREKKNEAMIKEAKEYTHRPGTGKKRIKEGQTSLDTTSTYARTDLQNNGIEVESDKPKKSTQNTAVHDNNASYSEAKADKTIRTRRDKIDSDEGLRGPSSNSDIIQVEAGKRIVESMGDDAEAGLLESYRDRLIEDIYELATPIAEVNAVAKEMDIKVTFGLKILTGEEQLLDQMNNFIESIDGFSSSSAADVADSEQSHIVNTRFYDEDKIISEFSQIDGLDIAPALYVKVHLDEHKIDFYWTIEKFQVRRYKIMELYGAWDQGSKSGLVEQLIDQSRIEGAYLFDPFVDNILTTLVLIGHTQVYLKPLTHLADIDQTYDLLDIDDEILGSLHMKALPCHVRKKSDSSDPKDISQVFFEEFSETDLKNNLVADTNGLLGRKQVVFVLKILSCHDIPDKYTNIHCQYAFNCNKSYQMFRTRTLRDEGLDCELSEELRFEHSHYICLDEITEEILNFFEHGFLAIQVVGQYRISLKKSRSLTIVSTIIDSINKYRSKLERGSNYGPLNYATNSASGYYEGGGSDYRRGATNASNSGSSSVASSATVNMFYQQNDDDDAIGVINDLSQDSVIDMILTKRKLDRAENQLHYLKRTVNIAEHYNKKHIPIKTVKKLLNSYGHELDSASLREEVSTEKDTKVETTDSKQSSCSIQ